MDENKAYEIVRNHDPYLAERLRSNLLARKDESFVAIRLRSEREDEYDASWWQRLTSNKIDVLKPYDVAVEDANIRYYACENDLLGTADRIMEADLARKEAEVDAGSFVYYVVASGTNVRRSVDGAPILYRTPTDADDAASPGLDDVISVAEYNRIYGGFDDE